MAIEKTFLTIDWDFFVPEDGTWDFGHPVKDPVVTQMLWVSRAQGWAARGLNLQKEMVTSGVEKIFWQRMLTRVAHIPTGITFTASDSHAAAYELAMQCDAKHVLSFDAHSDLGYHDTLPKTINVEDWLAHWLIASEGRATIVLSLASRELPDVKRLRQDAKARLGDSVMKRVRILSWEDFLNSKFSWGICGVHACRSPEWTPPWLDLQFNDFCGVLGNPGLTPRPNIDHNQLVHDVSRMIENGDPKCEHDWVWLCDSDGYKVYGCDVEQCKKCNAVRMTKG